MKNIVLILFLLELLPGGAAVGQPAAPGQVRPLSRLEARYGLDAKAAIERCPPTVAKRLSQFIASGEIDWLPRPFETLRAIARHGPVVAEFVMENASALKEDPDAFEAFLSNPPEAAYGRRSLAEAAAAVRAAREAPAPWWHMQANTNSAVLVGAGLLAGLLVGSSLARRPRRLREL